METHTVSSAEEVREVVKYAEPHVDLGFLINPTTSLADAHAMWQLTSDTPEGGGFGTLLNPDLLAAKREAKLFVEGKLDRLRRWSAYMAGKEGNLDEAVTDLQESIANGGPGVPLGFEPRAFAGDCPDIDVDQVVTEEELAGHIEKIRGLFLQKPPCSPEPDTIGYRSEEDIIREVAEQLVMTRFNARYLQVKQLIDGLSAQIEEGIQELEDEFINQPTNLGAGSGDFVRFRDISMYSGEAPRGR